MRIAYIINHRGETGLNGVVMDLVKVMMEHGHECSVYYLCENPDKESNVLKFPCKTGKLDLLKGRLDWGQFDVVHSNGLRPDVFVMLHKPLRTRTLFVSTIHCYVFQDFQDLFGGLKGKLLGFLYLLSKVRHDKIVTLSKDMMDYYKRYYGKKQLSYSYNTRCLNLNSDLDNEEREEVMTFRGDGILIGMNCVLLMRKGIDLMINVLAILPERYKLFIVGEGPHRDQFSELVKENNMEGRVMFAGQRPNAYRYLKYYDIYALPSRSEGFPLALLEAAEFGKRVVCSDLPVIKESFTPEEVSMFHLPDVDGLADAVVRASSDKSLEENIKNKFEKELSPSAFYKRYLNIYQCLRSRC